MRFRDGWLLLTILMVFVASAAAAAPRIVATEAVFNFGTVLQGESVEQVFHFRNDGDAPLVVNQVKTSCGCTAALLSASTLAPGESGEVRTAFDSARFTGQVQKIIYLYSNDPLLPILQLVLKGTVRQELIVSPAFAELGLLRVGVEKVVQLTISNQGGTPVALREVKLLVPDLTGELSAPVVDPAGSVKLTLRVTPTVGRGALNGYVVIATDSKNAPQVRIPVYGMIEVAPAPAKE